MVFTKPLNTKSYGIEAIKRVLLELINVGTITKTSERRLAMTQNEIAYQTHLEQVRSNQARELETHRANVASETETNRHQLATETETNRHNVITENQESQRIMESIRHNTATENVQWGNLRELMTHNRNVENESHRSNLAMEAIQ